MVSGTSYTTNHSVLHVVPAQRGAAEERLLPEQNHTTIPVGKALPGAPHPAHRHVPQPEALPDGGAQQRLQAHRGAVAAAERR